MPASAIFTTTSTFKTTTTIVIVIVVFFVFPVIFRIFVRIIVRPRIVLIRIVVFVEVFRVGGIGLIFDRIAAALERRLAILAWQGDTAYLHRALGPNEKVWAQQVLAIDPQALSQQPSAWSQAMKEQLQQQMLSWVQQLDERSECEPIQFHVRRNGNEPLQLQAGFESGLRAGDRVLLMHPSHIPSQMLEPGATQHLALAQVVKVGPDRTELQQVAGPALAAQGHWMALPL